MRKISYILFVSLLIFMAGCGKKESDSMVTAPIAENTDKSDTTTDAEEIAETEKEEPTSGESNDDYTKRGIWHKEGDFNDSESFVFLEDKSGFFISKEGDAYEVSWSYSPSMERIKFEFKERFL